MHRLAPAASSRLQTSAEKPKTLVDLRSRLLNSVAPGFSRASCWTRLVDGLRLLEDELLLEERELAKLVALLPEYSAAEFACLDVELQALVEGVQLEVRRNQASLARVQQLLTRVQR